MVDIFYRTNLEGRLLFVSPSVKKVLGYTVEELIGTQLADLYVEKDQRQQFLQQLKENDGQVPGFRAPLRHKDGREVWVATSATYCYDEAGKVAGVEGITRDITVELALSESEEKYRNIINNSSFGISLCDESGLCLVANKALAEMVGATVTQILSQNFNKIESWKKSGILNATKEAFESGQKKRALFHVGTTFGKDVWLDFVFVPYISKGKKFLLFIVEDITENKRTEEALRQSEIRFRSIFESVPDAIALTDVNREFVVINPAFSKIFGYSSEELEGEQTAFVYKSHEEFERQGQIRFNLSAEEKHKPYVLNYKRKNGEIFPGDTLGTAIKDAEGSTIGFLGVIRDITERKQAEEALRKYKHIFSVTNDLMSFTDRNYIYQAVNESYPLFFQKTRREIIGHSVADLIGADLFEPFVQDKLDRCLAGETVHYQEWFEFPELKRCYMDVFFHPFIDTVGEVTGVVTSAHDITDSKLAEQALRESNIALKVLVDQQQNTKEELEQQVLVKLKKLVFPYLDLLQGSAKNVQEQESLAIIRGHLSSITDSFTKKLSDPVLNLSQREILVADLVRQGKSTQEMAALLGLSLRTIEAYRMQLRKKLGLKTKKENLHKYLTTNFVKE